jgi:hypothetical protein
MKSWLTILILSSPVVATAQSDERAVVAAVQSLFDAMESKDVAAAREVLLPEGFFVRVEDGTDSVRSFTTEEFLASFAREEQFLERMWEPKVMIHGDIASVWTPYDFYLGGEFSHCGIDAFQIVRTDARWKIATVTFTVERSGCPESPLGPPE